MRLPASEGGLEFVADGRTHVKEAGTGSAAKPFEYATRKKIHLASFHVNRYDANGVQRIERNERAELVGSGTDRVDIHEKGAAEEHVRHRDEAGPFVDRSQQPVAIDRQSVVRRHHHDTGAEFFSHLSEGIADGWEVELGHH